MNDTNVLETKNLTKKYGKSTVVDSVNIKIKKGQIYGLLGKNGAGKTTTMCMILNLVNKTKGNVFLFGKDMNDPTNVAYRNVGSIIETPGFYHNLTGEENLKLFAEIGGTYNSHDIDSALDMVSLKEHKDKLFKKYSLGMKQRLGIALSLLKSPELLILDEPINGLDPIGIQEIRTLLRGLADEYGITILISSHILNEIEHIADIIGIMNNGKLIEEISMSNLQEKIQRYAIFHVDDIGLAKNKLDELGLGEGLDYSIEENGVIKLFSHLDSIGQINTLLVECGVEVKTFSLVKENLEEYFTNLIGDDFNA